MFIVFPNQLYEDLTIIQNDPSTHVYILEEPLYFHDADLRPVKTNQIKLTYMVACMRSYLQYVLHHLSKKQVEYVPYDKVPTFLQKVKSTNHVACYDPTDRDVIEKYVKLCPSLKVYESPNFLMSMQNLLTFREKNPRQSKHATFYKYVKNHLHVLEDEKSHDTENRSSLPSSFKPLHIEQRSYKSSIYTFAAKYVQSHPLFSTFPGTPQHVSMYPITFEDARDAVHTFLKQRISSFGTYQDAIHSEDPIVYHALISPMLNIGLLSPQYVLHAVMKMKGTVSMNHLEGFVRQLIGWREYMRYLYVFQYENLVAANHFQHKHTFMDWNAWYEGTTGLQPLDKEIQKAKQYGYSHHIVRLMMFLNFFILLEIHPQVIYTWFMEVVAIDAYDWVMKSNIYAMGWFYNAAMTKPYISTSNYIRKMSNYKHGSWCKLWDALFYRYLHTHKTEFTGSSKMYLQNLRYFEKKTKDEQNEILRTANSFLAKVTRPFKAIKQS